MDTSLSKYRSSSDGKELASFAFMAFMKKTALDPKQQSKQQKEAWLAVRPRPQPRPSAGHVPGVSGSHGYKVERSLAIDRFPEELFRFWRDFENLPHFMSNVESVTIISPQLSHWVVTAPGEQTVEWDAELIHESQNKVIAWRSLEGSDVDSAGSVRFEPAPGGRGTIVKVCLKYNPPGGAIGAAIAWIFGKNPEQQLAEDLRRFKCVMEAGEIPTIDGQPRGA